MMVRRCGPALLVFAFVWLYCFPIHAHDLVLDQLRLQLEESPSSVSGQLLLDPDLTRDPEGLLPPRETLLAFVREQVHLETEGRRLDVTWSVRELYTPGGAVPADLVVLASTQRLVGSISVQIGASLPTLVVTAERVPSPKSEPRSVLVHAGMRTPPFRIDATNDEWQKGGPELFPVPDDPKVTAATPSASSPWETARVYFFLGVKHILPRGWDHVLFVLALVLGTRQVRALIGKLSLFTVAHTITLGLGAWGKIEFPSHWVEVLIALSIAWAGVESFWRQTEHRGQYALVFAFGLIHGLGFSGVLRTLGLARGELLTSLLSFNMGVEAGQLLVVLTALALLSCVRPPDRKDQVRRWASLVPIAFGLWWTWDRWLGA